MPVTGGDDGVTLGELARRLDRFAREIQDSIAKTVLREVYDRDMTEVMRQLRDHDESIDALAANRRQAMYAVLGILGAVVAAVTGALVAGAHP